MRTALSEKDVAAIPPEPQTITPAPEAKGEDSYAEQILKYIPAEVVAFYIPALAIAAVLDKAEDATTGMASVWSAYGGAIMTIFLVALGASFVYVYRSAKKDLEKEKVVDPSLRAIIKAVISTIAFFVWALYIGGIFQFVTDDYQTIGTLGILFFTLISPPLYDLLASKLTLPPAIKIECELNPKGTTPAGINEVIVTNRGFADIEVTTLELYWKRWFNRYGDAPESNLSHKESVKANRIKKIKTQIPFRKEGVTHILRIKTKEGIVATSDPFADKPA